MRSHTWLRMLRPGPQSASRVEVDEERPARQQFRRGVLDAVPIALGLTVVGFIFGVTARSQGLSWAEAGLMSAVVYAGPSQFVAVGLLGQGAALLSIVLAAFIVNLRYVLYASSLGPYFRDRSTLRLGALAYGLVDAAYALSISDCLRHPYLPRKDQYFLGATLLMYGVWVPTAMAGGAVFSAVPEIDEIGLAFIIPAIFIAMLVPLWRSWIEVAATVLIVPLLIGTTEVMQHTHAVLVSMLIAILVGGTLKWMRQTSSR